MEESTVAPVSVEPAATSGNNDVAGRAWETAQRYLQLTDDSLAVEKGRTILEKLDGFKKGEVSLNELESLLVESEGAPTDRIEATEAFNSDTAPISTEDQTNVEEAPTEPQLISPQEEEVRSPVVSEAERIANEENSAQQEHVDEQVEEEQPQNISDSFAADVSFIAVEQEEPITRRLTPSPVPRELPENYFDKICDYKITPGDDLHNYNLKYVNILGQVVSVFKTQKGVAVLRVWDGRMLKYEKLTNLKVFRAEPAMIEDFISPATPELSEIPLDYCLDICVYGEWIGLAEKLKSGDIICIVNLHLWLPKAQRSITPTLHQGGQGYPFFRNIWLMCPEDAAADQMIRELRVTATDLKANNKNRRTSGGDQPRPSKKPESTVPMSLRKPAAEVRRVNEVVDGNRPGPSRVSMPTRKEEVLVEKQVRTPSPPVEKVIEQTTKRPEKRSVAPRDEPILSTSKQSRVAVLPEEEIQTVNNAPTKQNSLAKKKEEHWSKNVVVDDAEIDDLFACFLAAPKSAPKFVYPEADAEDEIDDIEEPTDSVIVIQRGATSEKANQTDFKTKTVAVQVSAQRKTIGLQAAIEEERPATRSSAMQTSPEKKAPPLPPARGAALPAKQNQGGSVRANIKQNVDSPVPKSAPTASVPPPLPARRAVNPLTDPTPSRSSEIPKSSASTPPRRKNPPPPPKLQLSAPRESAPPVPPPPRRSVIRVDEPIAPRRVSSLRSAPNSKTNSPVVSSSRTPPRPPKRAAAAEEPPVPPKRTKAVDRSPVKVKEEFVQPKPPKRTTSGLAPPVPPPRKTKETTTSVARSPAKAKVPPAPRRSLRSREVAPQEKKPLAPTRTSSSAAGSRNKVATSSKICRAPHGKVFPVKTGKSGKQKANIRK